MSVVSGGITQPTDAAASNVDASAGGAPVTLPVAWRTVIYIVAAPLAVGLFDLSGHPIDMPNIIHATATALASLGAIVAAAHITNR